MGVFGERMQKERQLRGVTLEEISVVTKIGTRSLKALEEEDFDKLPGGIFNKGFVRAYARYLGIDPDEAVSDYLAAIEQRNRPIGGDTTGTATQVARETVPDFYFAEEPQSSDRGVPIVAIIVVAVLAVGGWWMWSNRGTLIPLLSQMVTREPQPENPVAKRAKAPTRDSVATPSSQSQQTAASPSAAAPADHPKVTGRAPVLAEVSPSLLSPAAKAAEQQAAANVQRENTETISTAVTTVPPGTGFTVHLRATQDSWVTVTADGKPVSAGLLAAGDERSVRAGSRIVVHVGNAGGVQVAFNGKDLPAIGEPGEVRTLAFGPTGRVAYNPPKPTPEATAPQPAANPSNPQ